MTRGLTSGMVTASQGPYVFAHYLVELNFGSGIVHVWDGIGTLPWNSLSWLGLGKLGSISAVQEQQGVAATGMNLTLAWTDTGLLATALTENYQGRSAKVWVAFLDTSALTVIADPIQIFGGLMDNMTITDNGSSGSLVVNCESYLRVLDHANNHVRTDMDQQARFTGDLGLSYVTTIQPMPIYWGGASPQQTADSRKQLKVIANSGG